MAFTRRAYSSANAGANTFFVRPGYNSPAAVAGNTAMIGVWLDGTTTITTPAGWNLAASNTVSSGKFALYWRTADGTATDNPQINFGNYSGVKAVVAVYEEWEGITAYETASVGAWFSPYNSSKSTSLDTPGPGRLTWWFGGGYSGGVAFGSGPVTQVNEDRTVQTNLHYLAGTGIAADAPAVQAIDAVYPDYAFLGGMAFVSNQPPNAPILTGPPVDATLDRGVPNVFALDASDPDPGDSTSQTYWRTRIRDIGAAWETVTRISPVTTYEFAADYFAAGKYEWQAATRDAAGTPADEADLVWSASSFFTAADAPPAPIFTAPVNGAVIGLSSFEAVISAPDLAASEWRTVADDGAGNADPTTVYSPSVVLTAGDLRRHTFEFPVNNRTEHLQSRIKNSEGLWSQWADSRNPISYTPPANPVVALSVDNADGALIVSITNPSPGAGEPAASYNSVRIDDGDGKGLKHRIGSQMLALNTPYTYRLAVIERDYTGHVEVTTTAENGTTSTTTA